MSKALTFKQQHDLTIRRGKVTPKNADLILVDRSGSMDSPAIGGKSRINCVREALAPFKGRAHVLAFDDSVEEVDCDNIPNPRGVTLLGKALEFTIPLEPLHVLVMCDGYPTENNDSVLEKAGRLAQQCIIDALYIGPPLDEQAINFMRQLAEVGHGRFSMFDLTEKSPLLLSQGVESMLALPDPASVIKL